MENVISEPVSLVAELFSREPLDEAVAVVQGYGVQLRVIYGHLVIRDGIGTCGRERKYPKADRTLRRVVILGSDGYVSLEALAWCAEHGISVTMLNPDCEVVSQHVVSSKPDEPRLIRRQVLAADTATGTEIAREILSRKVTGQADLLIKAFDDLDTSARLYRYASDMQSAETLDELAHLERMAAKDYWNVWVGRVMIDWPARDYERIPANWLSFQRRKFSASDANTKRYASDPVNAMLNFGYSLGETESRIASIGHGLNPTLGFIHADKLSRNSLALDILETIRPEIDACILSLLGFGSQARKFTHANFCEPYGYPPGTVRLVAPLTHEIAESSFAWRKTAMQTASTVVNMLSGSHGRYGVRTNSLASQKAEFLAQSVDVNAILPDADWQKFQRMLPAQTKWDHSSISNRTVLAVFIYLARHHKPLAYVPPAFGISRRTLHERRLRWTRSGLWPEISQAIQDVASRPDAP